MTSSPNPLFLRATFLLSFRACPRTNEGGSALHPHNDCQSNHTDNNLAVLARFRSDAVGRLFSCAFGCLPFLEVGLTPLRLGRIGTNSGFGFVVTKWLSQRGWTFHLFVKTPDQFGRANPSSLLVNPYAVTVRTPT